MSESEDISKKVRIHKHNYAGEFGNVVGDPVDLLLEELIANPKIFSREEREIIINCYRNAKFCAGQYDMLGYKVDEQLDIIEDKIIPTINQNKEAIIGLLSKKNNYTTPGIEEDIRWAIENTPDICSKLSKIKSDDKGEAKPVRVMELIEEIFKGDSLTRSRKGDPTFTYSVFGRECSPIQVLVDPDGFEDSVIHNIIENTYKHAFITKFDTNGWVSSPQVTFWKRIWYNLIRKWRNLIGKTDQSPQSSSSECKVRISFTQKDKRIFITIENNGIPLSSDFDVDSVFEYGVGEGTGLGLFSASDFLEKYHAEISMESHPDDEYKVRFIIIFPIYE